MKILAQILASALAISPALAQQNFSPPPPISRTTLGQSRLPMILPSSGSMGNNGALTITTAVDQTYPSAYFYMPANAIVAGSTAGFYYGVMSDTTHATLYNNAYSSGTPTIPASPTAFSTTGPGAYTQTTAVSLTAYTISIPGNTLGIYDEIQVHGLTSYNNTAGAKTLSASYGNFTFGTPAPTTTNAQTFSGGFANTSSTGRQTTIGNLGLSIGSAAANPVFGSVDSTVAQNLTVGLKLATATDYLIIQNFIAEKVAAASN
jgi:hypothetical protein